MKEVYLIQSELQQKFLERIRSETEAIKKCTTNAGSVERTVTRLLPTLQNHALTSEIVKKWEKDHANDMKEIDDLAKRGCQELTIAFRALWEELVSKPAITRREKKLGLISYTINGIKADRFLTKIMRDVCQGAVCRYVDPPMKTAYARLENMYCDRIARSWDLCFAPNAYQYLLKTSQREVAAKIESAPCMPWIQLVRLAKAWKLRTEKLKVGRGRVRGEKGNRLYLAHLEDDTARFNYLSSDLEKCEAIDGQPEIFRRKDLHETLDRLVFELEIALEEKHQKTRFLIDESEDSHASTKKHQGDLRVLVPLCEELIQYYSGLNIKISLEKCVTKIKQEIKIRGIVLNSQNPTRIKEAIRQARANLEGKLRQIKTRKKGGSPKQSSKHSSKTVSQNHKRNPKTKNTRQCLRKSAS